MGLARHNERSDSDQGAVAWGWVTSLDADLSATEAANPFALIAVARCQRDVI